MTKIQQTDSTENGNSPLKSSENDQQNKSHTKDLEQVSIPKIPSIDNGKDDTKNFEIMETHQLISHPVFGTTLLDNKDYISDINERLKLEKAKNADLSIMQNLQKYFSIVTNKSQSWKECIPKDDPVRLIRGWDGYNEGELHELIRLVRNFMIHLREIQLKNSNSAKINIDSQENALYHMFNMFPNLLPTLKVFESTVINQAEARQTESNQPQDNTAGYADRHADIRWNLYELSQRMLHLDKQEGKLVATYVSMQPTDSHISFLRHSHNYLNKNTTVITIKENSAEIKILPYQVDDFCQTNIVNSFSWEENEWSATPVVIIVTEDLPKAIKIIVKNLTTKVIVLLGNDTGNLDNIQKQMNKIEKYNYVPTCWNDLRKSYQIELMSRKVLVCGKEKPLQWIGNHGDEAFNRLDGELLLHIINDDQPEITNPQRNQFEQPKVYVPLETVNLSGKTCIVTGVPFCGKSVILQQHTNSNDAFTFVLQTKDFLEWYLMQKTDNVAQAVSTFLANNNFGRDAVHNYLTCSEKQVQVILDEFQMVLDEEYDNLDIDETDKNINECILETCSIIIKNLKKLPNVFVTAATRSQCLDYLKTLIDQQLVQPSLSMNDAELLLSKFAESSGTTTQLPTQLYSDGVFSNVTPLLCDVFSSIPDLSEKENSNGLSHLARIKLCQSYCKRLFEKRLKIDNIVNKKDKKNALYEMNFVHVYIAYKIQFSQVNLKFLENLFFCRFNHSPTVSGLDYGLLKFRKPDFEKKKGPLEQGIEFVDPIFLNYWIAYGIIFLSFKCKEYCSKEWETFFIENILQAKCQSILEYFVDIYKTNKLCSIEEKITCKRLMHSCRKQTEKTSDQEIWTLLSEILEC